MLSGSGKVLVAAASNLLPFKGEGGVRVAQDAVDPEPEAGAPV